MITKITISKYNNLQTNPAKEICKFLELQIRMHLNGATSKIWHGAPVWFIDDNPVVGYWVRKNGEVQLLFWSGQSFDEERLKPEGSFKAAEIRYSELKQVHTTHLKRWLKKAKNIQWDYKNIVKRKGVLLQTKQAREKK
jgi:hypothetical protein